MSVSSPPRSDVISGTVMFTDIVGFTEFNALRGDDEALAMLALQERIIRDVIGQGARIVKELGDGLMLWFSDPCDAIDAGLKMQERFERETMEADVPLWVRIGVHSGRQTRRGADLIGHDVNVASRIVALAGSGEVLASEATVREAGARLSDVSFEQLGPAVMKGIPTPINLYRAERA